MAAISTPSDGQSATLAELERLAARATRDEMLARIHSRKRVTLKTPAATLILDARMEAARERQCIRRHVSGPGRGARCTDVPAHSHATGVVFLHPL
jgi:hypothetical protein